MNQPVPRCSRCFYELTGYGDIGSGARGQCPECGQSFWLSDETGYTTKPPLLQSKLWLPGFLTAFVFGFGAFAYFHTTNSLGAGVWVGVPVAMGCILGYRFRVKWWFAILGMLSLLASLLLALVFFHIAGVLCGLILASVILGPLLVGLGIGAIVRMVLKANGWPQATHLPVVLFMAIPFLWTWLEGPQPKQYAAVAVTTTGVIAGTPEQVWHALQFYEEVDHEPPLMMKIALPKPLRVTGTMNAVGDERVCHYTAGKLTKRITEIRPNEHLGFQVVEQEFEPSAVLLSGSFELQPVGDGQTRVVLTTVYRPLLGPRLLWQTSEELTIQTLHRHVLEGIRLDVEAGTQPVGLISSHHAPDLQREEP